jgi:hypothetical protein
MKSFLSLLSERRMMRASENAVLGLGIGSNPGPLAPELCVLPCAPLHIHHHIIYYTDEQYLINQSLHSILNIPIK